MAEWASQFEGEHEATELVGLAVDSHGDVTLAGHMFEEGAGMLDGRKDAIVMKLASSDGAKLWSRGIGAPGSHDWSTAVAADRSGDIFVAGQTDGYLFAPPTGAGQDIWVAKLSGGQGELVWGYQVGSRGHDVASTLTVDFSTGEAVVCGSTTGGLFDGPSAELSSSGSYRNANSDSKGETGAEPFCAKLAPADGDVVWASRLKGQGNDGFLAAAVGPRSGDVFAAGYTSSQSGVGGSDFVAVRINGVDGSERWRSTGGGGWAEPIHADAFVRDAACAVAVDGEGGVVIAGNTEGALFGTTASGEDTDAFVAKLNATDGAQLWGWQGGGSGNDYANAVALDASGDVYACGGASGRLFDDDAQQAGASGLSPPSSLGWESSRYAGGRGEGNAAATSSGEAEDVADMFVAKLDGRSGALVWGAQFGSGAGDQAVGLVLGPAEIPAGADAVGAADAAGASAEHGSMTERQEATMNGNSPLYLTGSTRGALYSKMSARWQDGWAVKLPNPPPKTLGILRTKSGEADSFHSPVTTVSPGNSAGVAKSSASDAAPGAITAGFASTVIGMIMVVLAALCFVLRRASHGGGALSAARYDPDSKSLFRKRSRKSMPDSSNSSGGGKAPDGVELTLLSEGGDAPAQSPLASRHGSGHGGGGGGGGGVRRDTSSPPASVQQPTFYL